jgi:beta-glucosidase
MKHLLTFAIFLSGFLAQAYAQDRDAFVEKLLGQMTLDEKIGQMTLFTSDWDVTGPSLRPQYKDDIKSGRVGAVFNAYTAKYTRELQRIAVENTRLKIPLLFGYDVIHGHQTIFPISLGESCSWDLQEIEASARIAAEEASAQGLHWTYAPMATPAGDEFPRVPGRILTWVRS